MKRSSLKKGMLALTLGLVALVPACRRRCYDCPPKCETPCEETYYDEEYNGEDAVVEHYAGEHKEYVEPVEEEEVYQPAKKVRKSYNRGYNNKKYAKQQVVEEQALDNEVAPVDHVEAEQLNVQQQPQQAGAYPHAEYAKPALNQAPDTLDQAFNFEQ